jgi:hypothetical protein
MEIIYHSDTKYYHVVFNDCEYVHSTSNYKPSQILGWIDTKTKSGLHVTRIKFYLKRMGKYETKC